MSKRHIAQRPSMRIDASCRSDIGLKRELNEDHCLLATDGLQVRGVRTVAVIADGMGGHDAGDVASKITCDFLEHQFVKGGISALSRETGISVNELEPLLVESMRKIHDKIVERARSFNMLRTMGSTCVAALVLEERTKTRLVVGWIGDSRCYVLRGSSTMLITEDDTCVWELYRKGKIGYDDLQLHPQRNVLTQALGTGDRITPHVRSVELLPGDTVLLSTDGLHGIVNDRGTRTIVRDSETAEDTAERLIEAANRAGGKDNISVAVVKCLPPERPASYIGRPMVRKGILTLGLAVFSLLGVSSYLASDAGTSPKVATTSPPATAISIFASKESPLAGDPVDVRFSLQPYEMVRNPASGVRVVIAKDGMLPDTMLLGSVPEISPNLFVIQSRFDSPRLHRLRITLLTKSGVAFGTGESYVDVRAAASPSIRKVTVTSNSYPSMSKFRLTRGIDNKIQVWLTDQADPELEVDVEISVAGATDLVTLTRRNRVIPKATLLEYSPGSRATLRTVGSREHFTQVLP